MKRTHLLTTLLALLALTVNTFAQNNTPTFPDYYAAADGKKGAELKTALCAIITANHKSLDYGDLWAYYETTDRRSDGKVWDMYSSKSNFTFETDQDKGSGGSTEGDKFNREHSFPNSWFGGVKNSIMYSDLFHLYPTDKLVNNKRGNNPFGETNGNSYKSADNFSKLGTCTYSGYTGTVFEPNDIYKGDFARTYFYMVTRYQDEIEGWYTSYGVNGEKGEDTQKAVLATLDGNKYPGLQSWQLEMLMKWAQNDPVDNPIAKETPRNEEVAKIQKNRNPFIDYPGLEEYIWGSMKNVAFSYDNYQQPTAIMTVKTEHRYNDGVMYNTSGQVVDKSYKGIVIVNGKKFFNK